MRVADGWGMSWWRLRLVLPRLLPLPFLPLLPGRPGLAATLLPSPCRDRRRSLLWTLLLWTLLLLLLPLPQRGLQRWRRPWMGGWRLQRRLGAEGGARRAGGIC